LTFLEEGQQATVLQLPVSHEGAIALQSLGPLFRLAL
jgi:hypothetical protein